MSGQPIMAYKGFVYKIKFEESDIVDRYMQFLDSGEKINLKEFGEIDLNDFKNIVDTYLNSEVE